MARILLVLLLVLLVLMILRAFRPPPTRPAPSAGAPRPNPRMTRAEALEILGLDERATREDVLAAYKSLIKKVHPDTPGGSGYLASKLNQAKQTLIG